MALPDNDEDFFSWLVVSSDWFPEATGAPMEGPVDEPPLSRAIVRPVSPLHAAALTASSLPSLQHQPTDQSGSSAADHIRHAATGFSRMAASVWASLGMAQPHAASSITSPDLLGGAENTGSVPESLSLDEQLFASVAAPESLRIANGAEEKLHGHKRRRGDSTAGISAARGAVPEALTLEDARRQIDLLTAENTALRAQLRAVSTASTKDTIAQERERKRQLSRLRTLAAAGADRDGIRHAVLRFKDLHSDFGKDRWVALRHHLTCLRSLLTPSLITKVCTWGVEEQGRGMGDRPADPAAGATSGLGDAAGVWASVAASARIDDEQRERILSLREAARLRRLDFAALLRQLAALEEAATSNFVGLETYMNRLMGTISPVQIARVLDWVDRNADTLAAATPLHSWPHASMNSDVSAHAEGAESVKAADTTA